MQAMQTAIKARSERYGIDTKTAKRSEFGYALGRIFLAGGLGPIEEKRSLALTRLEAGNRYSEDMARYHGLTGIPFPSARAQNLFAVRGHEGDIAEDRKAAIRSATNRRMELENALLSASGNGRSICTTVWNVCVCDIDEAVAWPDHMKRLLCCGLDELVVFYGKSADLNE